MPENEQETPEQEDKKSQNDVKMNSGQGPSQYPTPIPPSRVNAQQPLHLPARPSAPGVPTPSQQGIYNTNTAYQTGNTPAEFFSNETVAGAPLLDPNADFPTQASRFNLGGNQFQPPLAGAAHYQPPSAAVASPAGASDAQQRAGYNTQANPVPPGPLHREIAQLWPGDPAYRALLITIGIVLLCIIGGLILVTSSLGTKQSTTADTTGGNSTTVANTPTDDNTQLLQATAQAATATALAPTSIPASTPTAALSNSGYLTIQIGQLPSSVNNNSTVSVTVTTNHPGTQVQLSAYYSGTMPVTYQSQLQTVDANGNATISWQIQEENLPYFNGNVTATVLVFAHDKDGNIRTSKPQTIQINMNE